MGISKAVLGVYSSVVAVVSCSISAWTLVGDFQTSSAGVAGYIRLYGDGLHVKDGLANASTSCGSTLLMETNAQSYT